jgi:hypothetical protein
VGFPVGVPFVWNDGLSIAKEVAMSAVKTAMIGRSFMGVKNKRCGIESKSTDRAN